MIARARSRTVGFLRARAVETAGLAAWKAAGRPGLKSHEEFMAEVFGGSR